MMPDGRMLQWRRGHVPSCCIMFSFQIATELCNKNLCCCYVNLLNSVKQCNYYHFPCRLYTTVNVLIKY